MVLLFNFFFQNQNLPSGPNIETSLNSASLFSSCGIKSASCNIYKNQFSYIKVISHLLLYSELYFTQNKKKIC